jgi:hypothetical protein
LTAIIFSRDGRGLEPVGEGGGAPSDGRHQVPVVRPSSTTKNEVRRRDDRVGADVPRHDQESLTDAASPVSLRRRGELRLAAGLVALAPEEAKARPSVGVAAPFP